MNPFPKYPPSMEGLYQPVPKITPPNQWGDPMDPLYEHSMQSEKTPQNIQ